MITTLFLKIVEFFLNILDWVLPKWSLPLDVNVGFAIFFDKVISFNDFFPTVALVQCLSIIIAFNVIMGITSAGKEIIKFMRGTS